MMAARRLDGSRASTWKGQRILTKVCFITVPQELTALGEAVGTVSKGITAEQIAALPVQRYGEVVDPAAACSDEQ